MKPEQRELFRHALLRVADANDTQFGLSIRAFQVHVHAFAFTPDLEETRRELEYLEEKGFLKVPAKNISPENKTWKITAAGRDELAQHG